jgi:transcriptional regulator with XRE-family HTH domain
VTSVREPTTFAAELRRWRSIRRWSQLELALRAETTQRHLSFIEQGRSRPGRAMVVRIAESLELTLRERNQLLLAAGYAPAYPESDLDAPAIQPVLTAVRHVLDGHMPYPAVVARPFGEIVDSNAALSLLTDGVAPELLQSPVNVLRLALHPDGMSRRVVNLAEWGRHITNSVRNRARQHPHPRFDELLAELESYLPDSTPGPDHVGFAVPLRLAHEDGELNLITTLTSFATAVDVTLADLHLEAFLPADEATATVLHRSMSASHPSRG